MRKFFSGLWRLVTAPFRLLWWIVTFPVRSIRQVREFLSDEPEEHDLVDVLSNTISSQDVRQSLWDHVEELRKHLLRSLLALAFRLSSPNRSSGTWPSRLVAWRPYAPSM
jgi:hypothetical protein